MDRQVIKLHQVWQDKKTGDTMIIRAKKGGKWIVVFDRGTGSGIHRSHTMSPQTINKFYSLVEGGAK